jgi:hypothetical protein
MALLTKDQERLERRFPGAARFLKDAEMRAKCFSRMVRLRDSEDRSELVNAAVSFLYRPCCREPWFLDLLVQEFKKNSRALNILWSVYESTSEGGG